MTLSSGGVCRLSVAFLTVWLLLIPGQRGVLGQLVSAGVLSCQNGATVSFPVTLATNANSVASVESIVTFDSVNTPVARNTNGSPKCTVNAAIQKSATFSFLPTGCSGSACNQVRANIYGSTAPIANGATLYSCTVNVAATAPTRDYQLSVEGVVARGPNGAGLPGARGQPGEIDVIPSLTIGSGSGRRGSQVTIPVMLSRGGGNVLAAQNVISFNNLNTPIARYSNGSAACTVNPAIQKESTTFGLLPNGCTGNSCNAVRAVIYSQSNSTPIGDGVILYTCVFNISASAPLATYPMVMSDAITTTPRQGVGPPNHFVPVMINGNISVIP